MLPRPGGPRALPGRDYGHVCHRATSSFSRSRKCSTTFHFEAIVNCVLICFTYYMFLQFILQMDICSDVSEELIAYAERLEANPPRVARMELASGLRRLAQRCIRGVQRASCRGTVDAAVPRHRSSTAHTADAATADTGARPSTAAGPSAGEFAGTYMPTGSAGTHNCFVLHLFPMSPILCLMHIVLPRSCTSSFR